MRNYTSIAERVDGSTAKALSGPGRGLRGNDKVVVFEPKLRVCVHEINIRRDYASFEGKDGLDEAC